VNQLAAAQIGPNPGLALRLVWEFWILATWNGLPGPWWVKAILITVCLAIPGPQDELLLIAVTAGCRAWKARRTTATVTQSAVALAA
jgi:hypothetical protein